VLTTTGRPATEIAAFVGGFVAAEGCFHPRPEGGSYSFTVSLGASDQRAIVLLRNFFGCGFTTWRARRKSHYDDEVTFGVRRMQELVEVIVPFMDEHLPPSYKREQYLAWRAEVLDYWEHGMRRRRPCTVEGCEVIQRAKGLCRHHYYEAFGR
jgi:hypothetical protein